VVDGLTARVVFVMLAMGSLCFLCSSQEHLALEFDPVNVLGPRLCLGEGSRHFVRTAIRKEMLQSTI